MLRSPPQPPQRRRGRNRISSRPRTSPSRTRPSRTRPSRIRLRSSRAAAGQAACTTRTAKRPAPRARPRCTWANPATAPNWTATTTGSPARSEPPSCAPGASFRAGHARRLRRGEPTRTRGEPTRTMTDRPSVLYKKLYEMLQRFDFFILVLSSSSILTEYMS